MVPHGAEVLARILALGSELFNSILIDVTDLLALWGEIKFGVVGKPGGYLAAAHCCRCYGEKALEGI